MMTSTIKVILLCQNKTSSDGTKMSLCYFLVPWCLVTENIQPKVTTTSLADLVEAFLGLVTYLLCTRAALS